MDFVSAFNYAEAASVSCNKAELSVQKIQQYYGLLKNKGGDVFVSSPKKIVT